MMLLTCDTSTSRAIDLPFSIRSVSYAETVVLRRNLGHTLRRSPDRTHQLLVPKAVYFPYWDIEYSDQACTSDAAKAMVTTRMSKALYFVHKASLALQVPRSFSHSN